MLREGGWRTDLNRSCLRKEDGNQLIQVFDSNPSVSRNHKRQLIRSITVQRVRQFSLIVRSGGWSSQSQGWYLRTWEHLSWSWLFLYVLPHFIPPKRKMEKIHLFTSLIYTTPQMSRSAAPGCRAACKASSGWSFLDHNHWDRRVFRLKVGGRNPSKSLCCSDVCLVQTQKTRITGFAPTLRQYLINH